MEQINDKAYKTVAPHAGAWIETSSTGWPPAPGVSRPTRARGLKPSQCRAGLGGCEVAPHAGAWIETTTMTLKNWTDWCRAPRGRVD